MTEREIESLRAGVLAMHASAMSDTDPKEARSLIARLLDALEEGDVRAATQTEDGDWEVHSWVKTGILAAFRLGGTTSFDAGPFSFIDREMLPPRRFQPEDRVRIVPGGSAVRRGAHLGAGTVCMPPSYVNVGAFIGAESMVDSHALVGSCAQVGAGVHLSAAAQIGGVLEPAGALPVIIEDDVFVGGGCGIYEGCIVRHGAVLAPGVVLSRSTPVYDLVKERVIEVEGGRSLEIPAGAVVVPGSRPGTSAFARSNDLSIYAPIIVKYRDERTDAATELEGSLRAHR